MIYPKQIIIDYLKAQKDKEEFAKNVGLSVDTIWNVISGQQVGSKVVAALLKDTGFEFEKAFELKEDGKS